MDYALYALELRLYPLHKFCDNVRHWSNTHPIPGYRRNHGAPFLADLLNYPGTNINMYLTMDFMDFLDTNHPFLLDKLNGPHGWAILQMLLARKKETS